MHEAAVSSFLTTCQDDYRNVVRSSFSTIYPQSVAMSDEVAIRWRQALQRWIDDNLNRKTGVQTIANAAGNTSEGGFSEAAVRHFLKPQKVSAMMSERIWRQFAAGATVVLDREVSVAELRGEAPRSEPISGDRERPGFADAQPRFDPQSLPQAVVMPETIVPGRPDIPVWASAQAGSDGAMVLVDDPIDWIKRSERMQGVQKPFAFYVIGTSMSPAVDHGDQVIINPSLLPTPGKDHVFLQTTEDGTILALVKRLTRIGASSWKVRQYNPEKEFDLPKSIWSKALLVAEKRIG